EPILEISTDKVDAEIPAPSGGTLVDIQVAEGETVEVGTIVAYIDTDGGAPAASGGEAAAAPAGEAPKEPAREPAPAPETGANAAGESEASEPERETAEAAGASTPGADGREESADERLRRRSTPVVRRIAEEHDVDLSRVEGSGRAG